MDYQVSMSDRARSKYIEEVIVMLLPALAKLEKVLEWNKEHRFLTRAELDEARKVHDYLSSLIDYFKVLTGETASMAVKTVAMADILAKTADKLDDCGAHEAAEKVDQLLQKCARELQVQNIGETGVPAPAGQQVLPQSSKQVVDTLKKDQPKMTAKQKLKMMNDDMQRKFFSMVGDQPDELKFSVYVDYNPQVGVFLQMVGGNKQNMRTIGSPYPFKSPQEGAKVLAKLANYAKQRVADWWKKSMGSVDTIKVLAEIASDLDDKGAYKQAAELDDLIKKMAQEDKPTDFPSMVKQKENLFKPKGQKNYFPKNKKQIDTGGLMQEFYKTLNMLGFNKQQAVNYKLKMFNAPEPGSVVLRVTYGVGMGAKPIFTATVKKEEAANKIDEAAAATLTHFESRMARK